MAKETKATVIPMPTKSATDLSAKSMGLPASLPGQAAEVKSGNAHPLRGHFALSLCRAHRIGADDGSTPCQEGASCDKQSNCLDLADKTLAYADSLESTDKAT